MAETAQPTPNKKLRYERERRSWSQQELADQVGTTPLNISRWERGVNQPGPYFRQQLSTLFGLTPQQLGLIAETGVNTNAPAQNIAAESNTSAAKVSTEVVPVALWNVPYRRNLFFTGREDILTQLRNELASEGQPIALAQPQAISGLGGIGKTQTAIEYTYRYRDTYNAILWARADSADLLISDFLTIANLLTLPERNEQEQQKVVSAVLRWFDTHKNWLLILDNADDLDMVKTFMPTTDKGHIILTTRAQAIGILAQRIEIEKMSIEEGTVFLLRRIKRLKSNAVLETVTTPIREQAQAIVEAVDGLPLALDQAGAYIEETGCSLSDYLKFYKTRRNRLLRTRGRDASGHPEPVATTWSLSFERVERANPAAAELLRLLAFLHPDAIPERMIMGGASELGTVLGPVAEDELDLNDAIGELHKYSLVKRDPQERILNIHRLVQVVIKDGMNEEMQKEWAERAIRMLNRAFPRPETVEAWPLCQEYLPHALLCVELIEQWDITLPEAALLLNQMGKYLRARAEYKTAEFLLQKSLAVRTQLLGSGHLDVAASLNELALLYRNRGIYPRAEDFYQQALMIREQKLGSSHLEVAQVIKNLAKLYNDQGKYEQAEPLFQRAISVYEKELGVEHPDVASILDNLAWLYYDQCRYQEAEVLYRRALSILEKNLGMKHPDLAQTLSNLGVLYWQVGKYQKAEALFQRALTIFEQVYGLLHPEVAGSLNNLGVLFHHQGQYGQSESFLLHAITIYEEVYGAYHPELANTLNELGIVYRNQGKYEQAESLFKRAIVIREQTLGPNHPELTKSLNQLAILYRSQGKYNEAEPYYLRALEICKKELTPNHILTAGILLGMGNLYTLQEKYEQAEPLFERVLTIYEYLQRTEHPLMAAILGDYANLLRKTNRTSEATALEARAQAIRVKQI